MLQHMCLMEESTVRRRSRNEAAHVSLNLPRHGKSLRGDSKEPAPYVEDSKFNKFSVRSEKGSWFVSD